MNIDTFKNEISIKSYRKKYKVEFKNNYLENFIFNENTHSNFYIIDKNIYDIYFKHIELKINSFVIIEAIEQNKNIEYILQSILPLIVKCNLNKKSNLIAIGGGITQDITAFISSVYMRGINWTLFPTTLLSQCDSCIGSKSSINYGNIKNLLGTFYPPDKIFIDINFLNTLPIEHIYSGIGEIIKIFAIDGSIKDFQNIENILNEEKQDYSLFQKIIKKSLELKKNIIEVDEFDDDIRNIMNFGHCFGHALESSLNFKITHGICVSYGILVSLIISKSMNLVVDFSNYNIVFNTALKSIKNKKIFTNIDFDSIEPFLYKDKKYSKDSGITFILFKNIGNIIKKERINIKIIKDSFDVLQNIIEEY